MKGMTAEAMAKAAGGKLLACEGILGREITAVVTDSRKIVPGCAFVAIKGERVDGHSFVPQTLADGAMLAIVEVAPEDPTLPCILVESTLLAIQRIAELYRKNLGLPVVGITGSVGKTSTKEAVAAVLSRKYRVLKTEKNFNNNLGLPLTIFRLTEEDEIAVLEMGISHFGEMEDLAQTARPDVMVITNIGTCHLEFLGDRDGIFRAKTACLPFVRDGGLVVLNGEDDKLSQVTSELLGASGGSRLVFGPVFYGLSEKNGVYAKNVVTNGLAGSTFTIVMDGREVSAYMPLPGRHMVLNALAAAAVGRYFGVADANIVDGLATMKALGGRVNILETPFGTVIDDCYNASPASMKAALELLASAEGPKTAILGDMGELGTTEKELHREVGAFAGKLGIDRFLLAGTLAGEIAEGIKESCPDAEIVHLPNTEALLADLITVLPKGGNVLVKASHFMGFERIVKLLEG